MCTILFLFVYYFILFTSCPYFVYLCICVFCVFFDPAFGCYTAINVCVSDGLCFRRLSVTISASTSLIISHQPRPDEQENTSVTRHRSLAHNITERVLAIRLVKIFLVCPGPIYSTRTRAHPSAVASPDMPKDVDWVKIGRGIIPLPSRPRN